MAWREDDDFVYFEEEKVKEWLEKAESCLKLLEDFIDKEIMNAGRPSE